MSPEAARGEPVDKTSDVYSAAAVLFSLLSGRMPFPARTAQAVLHAQIEQPAPLVTGHGPALRDLLTQAMAKEPAARPPDARAFLQRLKDAAREHYGPAWLERASIAAIVVAIGTGAATLATNATQSAAGSVGGARAPTVFVDAAATTGPAPAAGTAVAIGTARSAKLPRVTDVVHGAPAADG